MDICLWLPFLIYLIQLARQVFPDLLAMDIGQPDLLLLMRQFLAHITGPNPNASESDQSEISLPTFLNKISVYKSAIASFYAPSDICGIKSMHCEWIHTTPSW